MSDDSATAKRNTPLTVELTDGQLIVRIGIDTLAFVTENMTALNPYNPKTRENARIVAVTDPDEFARDVIRELTAEEEDGSSELTNLIDKCCEEAFNDGSMGAEARNGTP